MSSLLIQEVPLMVLPTLATKIGLNEAMFLQQLHYWVDRSHNEFEGRKWVYNTVPEWCKQFPFWSKRTLERILSTLEKQGLILVGNYNRKGFDRTKWYTVNYEKLTELEAEDEKSDAPGNGNMGESLKEPICENVASESKNVCGGINPPNWRDEENQGSAASTGKREAAGGINPPKWRNEESRGLEGNPTPDIGMDGGMSPPDCQIPIRQNGGMDTANLAGAIPENNNRELSERTTTTTRTSRLPLEDPPKPGKVARMLLSAPSYGLSETTLRKYLREYGEDLVLKEFALLKKHMDEKKPIQNPGGWLCRALEQQYEDTRVNYEKIQAEKKAAAEARNKELLERFAREDEARRKAEHTEIDPSNPFYAYLHRRDKGGGAVQP